MKTDEIREKYLEFFKSKGHTECASDVLVPKWDSTVLFTPAGMNPFKDHFLGNVELEFTRATSSQKCLRTGDIENVGRTAYHHTFFEMLGNFSFGDYFKKDAIHWAWEFLTDKKWLAVDPERLSVTVYLDDDEAADIWHKEVGLPLNRIERLGEHDNFWPAGAPSDGPDGVSGPCSEIFFHPDEGGECEIWNLVFTQFNRLGDPPNNLHPLPSKNIDTGMGLERIAATLQGVETNFHIDSLISIVNVAAEVCGKKYDPNSEDGRRIRRITDHVRACTMAIHENTLPGPNEENYVIRRLLRRAVLQGHQMGLREPFLAQIVPAAVEALKRPYPELEQTVGAVQAAITQEESSFYNLIENNMRFVERLVEDAKSSGSGSVDAAEAARLFQTRGVPAELTSEVARNNGLEFDWDAFEKEMEKHGKVSGVLTDGVMGNSGPIDELKSQLKKTAFVGYESTESKSTVKGLGTLTEKAESIEASHGDCFIVLDETPFYARSGGQESDFGKIVGPSGKFEVTELQKSGDLIVHFGSVIEGSIANGDSVTATVDPSRRTAVCRAHSATHILHYALQSKLGTHAQQRGSKVEDDVLRFDFANDGPVTAEQLVEIESMTHARVKDGLPIKWETIPLEQAKTEGAMMLFGEKYPDPVRMVSMGNFSKELCGGTHLTNTSEVEAFEIVSETGVSAGTRRIEAVTGTKAKEIQQQLRESADAVSKELNVGLLDIPAGVENLMQQIKSLKKQLSTGKQSESPAPPTSKQSSDSTPDYQDVRAVMTQAAMRLNVPLLSVGERVSALVSDVKSLAEQVEQLSGSNAIDPDELIEGGQKFGETLVIAKELTGANPDLMRQLIDRIRKKTNPVAIFFANSPAPGKVMLIAGLSRDLVDKGIKAGDWVKKVAPVVGGNGGGKPDLAQAGGSKPEKIDEALEAAVKFIGDLS